MEILTPAMKIGDVEQNTKIYRAAQYFIAPENELFADAVKELAPKANLRQKKSKVFIALCKALGIWQNSGKFQIDFSALCNEFNAKKIDFKLIVSINPAHFLTMIQRLFVVKIFDGKSNHCYSVPCLNCDN